MIAFLKKNVVFENEVLTEASGLHSFLCSAVMNPVQWDFMDVTRNEILALRLVNSARCTENRFFDSFYYNKGILS